MSTSTERELNMAPPNTLYVVVFLRKHAGTGEMLADYPQTLLFTNWDDAKAKAEDIESKKDFRLLGIDLTRIPAELL